MTSFQGQPWATSSQALYPRLAAGVANLPCESLVLLDQLQAVDAGRVRRVLGRLSGPDYEPIRASLVGLLG